MTTAVLSSPAWADYAAGSRIEHFQWWCRENCRHVAGPFAGTALELEPWQEEFFGEALAVDEDGMPYWSTVGQIVARKNGKTTMTSAVGAYEADESEQLPIAGLAATSDEQASELFDAIAAFVHGSPYLTGRFHVRDYDGEIARKDGGGFIRRMKMDWRRLHGKNLSKLIADEIHAWTTPNLVKSWEALTTGDGARPEFQTFFITTPGEPDPTGQSILGQLIAANEAFGEVEQRPGLTISRDHEARVLIYRFHAPMPDADPGPVREAYQRAREAEREADDGAPALRAEFEELASRCLDAVELANPASWVRRAYLRRKLLDPKLSRSSFMRYHASVEAAGEDAWMLEELFDSLAVPDCPAPEVFIVAGRKADLGADGSRNHDCTVVAWAGRANDGAIEFDARVFSVRPEVAHHQLCRNRNGHIDYPVVEGFIADRLTIYEIGDAAYDPRYLDRSADLLEDKLPEANIFAVEPGSKHMREALAVLDRMFLDGTGRHRGDPVLKAHFLAAGVEREPKTREIRRVFKRHPDQPIDAVPAVALAVWRASRRPVNDEPMVAWM